MIIRLCTENKNEWELRDLCAKRFDAFTIYYGIGAWKGVLEPSLTIEIAVLDEDTRPYEVKVTVLALDIKVLNQQEAVLIEYINSKNELI